MIIVSSRLLKNAGTVFFGSGFSKALLVSAEIYCAFALGADGYGRFAIALALALILATLAQCGLQFGIVRQLAIFQEEENGTGLAAIIRMSMALVFLVSGSMAVLLISSADWVADTLFRDEDLRTLLQLTGVLIVFEALNQILSAIFRGLRQFRKHVITFDLVRNAAFVLCIPVGLIRGISATEVFVLLLGGSILGTLYGLASVWSQRSRYRLRRPDFHTFSLLLRFSSPLVLWQVVQIASNRLLVVLSGIFLAASQVGVLAFASRLVNLLDFPQTVVNSTTFVEFSRLHHREDLIATNRLYQMAAAGLLAICTLLALPMLFNTVHVMRWMGAGYEGYGWVVIILFLAKLVDVGTGPAGQVIMAFGRLKAMLALSLFSASLQLIGVLPLVAIWGLAGAVLGTALRTLVFIGARHWFLISRLGVNTFHGPFLRIGAVSAAGVLLAVGLSASIPTVYSSLAGPAVGMIVILTGGWVTLARDSEAIRQLPSTLLAKLTGSART